MSRATLFCLLLPMATSVLACGLDLEAPKKECRSDLPCPAGSECYRGFCILGGDEADPPVIEPVETVDAGALDAIAGEQVPADGAASPSTGTDARAVESDASRAATTGPVPAADASQTPTGQSPPPAQPPQPKPQPAAAPPRAQTSACTEDSNCKPECAAGALCAIDCSGVSNCDISCAGACSARCIETDNCRMRCAAGASCDLDCRQADGNCEKIRCEPGASCLLSCGEAEHCEFERCSGVERKCPNGVVTCDRACP